MLFSNDNIIYRTRNNQAVNISGKFASLVGIVVGLAHFNENPVFISIMVIVLASLIIFTHEEELIVFKDKFVHRPGFSLPGSAGKEYYYKDIKDVIFPVDYDVKNLAEKFFYRNRLDSRDKIHIIFKNGKEELLVITIRMYVAQAINKIKEQLSNFS